MAWSLANKRYNARVIMLSLVYAVALIAATYGFKHHLFSGLAAYLAALLPALPIIGIFATIGRYMIEEQDEYLRMLLYRQTLYASAITLSVATIWGFLETFELVGHVAAYYASVVWFAGLGIGALINRVTLGASVSC